MIQIKPKKKYDHVKIFPAVYVQPQIYPTCTGERWITYLIVANGVAAGYARCFCRAEKAARWLMITL